MKNKHKTSLSRERREKNRLKAGKLFEKGISQAEIAKKFNVTRAAASQWHKTWKKKGIDGLKSKGHPGFSSKLTEEKRKIFKKAVLKGPQAYGYETNLWTLARLREVMKKENRIDFKNTWMGQIMKDLGFTPQKPQIKPKERNEKAIKKWKTETLPNLKKNGLKK